MKSNIIKGLTITLFCSLIIAFVVYKAGYFTEHISSGSTISNPSNDKIQLDSTKGIDSLKKLHLLSSSKSLTLVNPKVKQSTTSKAEMDSIVDAALLSSSKSGIIFKRNDFQKSKKDTTVTDSIKR
ncbi:MAG: hypothetical protein MK202_11360 [Tenacibaculum sp.]|nr:hypothetical protein [Tenacibaculum sp.]